MEAERLARDGLRSLMERQSDARDEMRRAKLTIENCHAAFRHGVGDLLQMPLSRAVSLSQRDVETFAPPRAAPFGEDDVRQRTGINWNSWKTYLLTRTRYERITEEYEKAKESAAVKFAIIPNLVDAVIAWGFADPRKEI